MHYTHERITATVSANLKVLRRRLAITRQAFAAAIGVNYPAFCKYCEGACQPPVKTCLAICLVGGVSLDQFLTTKLK